MDFHQFLMVRCYQSLAIQVEVHLLEPIPVIHWDDGTTSLVPEDELPLELPKTDNIEPSGTGESPLANVEDWVNVYDENGRHGLRETNTMPQWAGSSWYFLRYPNPHNDKELISKEDMKKWLPVDMYVGGIEHDVLHLLYARFYTKFLNDIGVVDFAEPFKRLFNQGMVTKAGAKMSKSKGNVVSPDELVEKYGCDSLRMYELFIGPPELDSEWDDRGIEGVYRFINKVWKLVDENTAVVETKDMERLRHKLIRDITVRMENFNLNTVVSGFMQYTNELLDLQKKEGGLANETLQALVILLAPFIPHTSEELWAKVGGTGSVFANTWPTYDEEKMKEDEVEIVVQITGKIAGRMKISPDAEQEEAVAKAKALVADKLEGKTVVKEIYVKGRIVNLVAK